MNFYKGELNTYDLNAKITYYRTEWKNRILRMDEEILPKKDFTL